MSKPPGKHTPGPWEAAPWNSEGEHEPFKFTIWSKTEGGPPVAIVETTPANAALMEAAPDLLDAGRELLEADTDKAVESYPYPDRVKMRVAFQKLEAAIAKAEGRQ